MVIYPVTVLKTRPVCLSPDAWRHKSGRAHQASRHSALKVSASSLSLANLGLPPSTLTSFYSLLLFFPDLVTSYLSSYKSLYPPCCWFIARPSLYLPNPFAIMASKIMGAAINSTTKMITDHHFYPLEVEVKNYLPNKWGMELLLAIFSALCLGILTTTRMIVNRIHPNLPKTEKAAICWFVICKCIIRGTSRSIIVLWQCNWHQLKTNWVL